MQSTIDEEMSTVIGYRAGLFRVCSALTACLLSNWSSDQRNSQLHRNHVSRHQKSEFVAPSGPDHVKVFVGEAFFPGIHERCS
jgi:hypothetical protein